MKTTYNIISKLFAPAGVFVLGSLDKIIIWLIVMFFVVLCDLIAGCRKAFIMGEDVRFSRAWRATMGKTVTYFSFIVMVVMINIASGNMYSIDKWAILFICFIEGCSIISNILQPKGYNLNLGLAIGVFVKKVFGVDKEDTEKIIKERRNEEKDTDERKS